MNLPDEAPKLNPWPFIAADVLLFGAAALIASKSNAPLTGAPLFAVGALAFLGALIAVLPFLMNFARRQDAALTQRQQEIAALAQSTAASAEQLGIAAGSLHSIADSAFKAVKHAEALPGRLQEKIHEFKEQLNEVTVSENEALSQEVNTLRAAETERMETVVTTVRKLSSEFARLEAASRKNVNELTEALGKFSHSAEAAAAEAATTIASARAGAEKSLSSAHAAGVKAIETSLAEALAEFEAKIASFAGQLTAKIDAATDALDARLTALQALSAPAKSERSRPRPKPEAAPEGAAPVSPAIVREENPPLKEDAAPSPASAASLPSAPLSSVPAASVSAPSPVAPDFEISHPLPAAVSPAATEAAEAAPLPASTHVSASVAGPVTAPTDQPEATDEPAEAPAPAETEPVRAARKRAPRHAPDGSELTLGLDLPPEGWDPEPQSESALSADGMTRLIVTAYIGIGNKLYLRGEGAGLSWERGLPLQFVSIGKWRWESADAQDPVRLKLFKNDETECTALGEIEIEPGHQREVTAKF